MAAVMIRRMRHGPQRETWASLGCLVLIVAWGALCAMLLAYWIITGHPVDDDPAMRARANMTYEDQVNSL